MKIKAGTIIFLLLGFLLILPQTYANQAATYYNRGNDNFSNEEFDQAIANYTRALEINPRYASAYTNRGNTYNVLLQYDNAISDFDNALKINPQSGNAYNGRAISYYFQKKYDKAWRDVHKAQALGADVNPGFIQALRDASGRNE
ncbi:MAG: tetratricopeptide repeat protein [Planctomycetota bacterium]